MQLKEKQGSRQYGRRIPTLSARRPLCTIECPPAEQQSPQDVSDSPGALGWRRLGERLRKSES